MNDDLEPEVKTVGSVELTKQLNAERAEQAIAGVPGAPPAPAPDDDVLREGDSVHYKTPKGWGTGVVSALNGDKVLIRTVNAKMLTRTRKNVKKL